MKTKVYKTRITRENYKGWANNYYFTCGACGCRNHQHVVEYRHNESHDDECDMYDTTALNHMFECDECGAENVDELYFDEDIECSCNQQRYLRLECLLDESIDEHGDELTDESRAELEEEMKELEEEGLTKRIYDFDKEYEYAASEDYYSEDEEEEEDDDDE